jgi:dopamine beta-monooxygenase
MLDTGSTGAQPPDPGFVPDPSWQRWEIRFPDYEVPREATTYACAAMSFPLDQAAHIVAFEPAIDDGTVVHHMILGTAPERFEGVIPCYPSAPDVRMKWGWAPGIAPLALPAEAGLLVGAEAQESVHFVLQIHYDNPRQESGHRDRSGVNVYVSRELRPHHATLMSLGDVAGLEIPPGQPAFDTVHRCLGSSTEQWLPEPIEVFGSWLHAHKLATALWTEQFRDGRKVGDLGRHVPYDFDDQHLEPLNARIEPGDELVTHCVYDTTSRTEPTVGGDGTNDEMCLNFLFYYPALPYSGHCDDG